MPTVYIACIHQRVTLECEHKSIPVFQTMISSQQSDSGKYMKK
jgi:hypothetical protein